MDADARALEREQDPEARAAVLAARLRAGEECACCGGEGRLVTAGGSSRPEPLLRFPHSEWERLATVPCPACAGLSRLERVRLGAYCGDEAAMELVGPAPHAWLPFPREGGGGFPLVADVVVLPNWSLAEWARGLARWGQPVLVRAAVAAARVALATLECAHEGEDSVGCWDCLNTGYDNADGPQAERAIEAAEAWLACPCEAHERAWRGAFLDCSHQAQAFLPSPDVDGEATVFTREAPVHAARLAGKAPVREAARRALAAWALGGAA